MSTALMQRGPRYRTQPKAGLVDGSGSVRFSEAVERAECGSLASRMMPQGAKQYGGLSKFQVSRMRSNGEHFYQVLQALKCAKNRSHAAQLLSYFAGKIEQHFSGPTCLHTAYKTEAEKDAMEDAAQAKARCLSDPDALKAWRERLLDHAAEIPSLLAAIDARIDELGGNAEAGR